MPPTPTLTGEPPPPAPSPDALRQQKEERTVMAFLQNLRAQIPITMNETLL
jgi:hypothetical protein